MTSALQAIVFDFDGVIANSEPLHLRSFQEALAAEGHVLTSSEYYARYLGFDDVAAFEAFAVEHRLSWARGKIDEVVRRKGAIMQQTLAAGAVLFPGAKEFIQTAAAAVPVAIASGAMRHEIEEIVRAAGIAELFVTIVAAGDTPHSKPSPAPYALAFERLCAATGRPLDPRRCVAIEDSRWGLVSAQGAGLRCVGVTNSYPAHELTDAELVVDGLKDLTLETLNRLCASPE